MKGTRMMCAAFVMLVLAGLSSGAEEAMKAAPAHAGLERLRQMAGVWTTQAQGQTIEVRYRVIAAGSAVVEEMFPGTPYEMVTVYHLDQGDLVLTHYCAEQNQPRMRATGSGDGKTIAFKFDGGTNLDPAKDGHMHAATLTFIDNDTVHAEWTYFENGAKKSAEIFDLKRKKG